MPATTITYGWPARGHLQPVSGHVQGCTEHGDQAQAVPGKSPKQPSVQGHIGLKWGVRGGITKSDILNLIFFPMVFTHNVRMKAP